MSADYVIPDEFYNKPSEIEITKDEYYMALALVASSQSIDPSTQVGVCYVSKDGEVLSLGHNHPPKGWSGPFIWNRELKNKDNEKPIDPFFTKYPYVVHAEQDGLKNIDYNGATCYVTLFPCSNCAKLLIEHGIEKVIYLHMGNLSLSDTKSALYLLSNCGIEVKSLEEVKNQSFEGLELNVDPDKKENVKILKKYYNKD